MPTYFTEFTRVQIPALLHLERLGYHFIPCAQLPHYGLDRRSNILTDILRVTLSRLNPDLRETEVTEKINELNRIADYDDLGREFYKKLTDTSDIRLIDFEHPENNTWHCTIELECENQMTHNHFRPDLTCFINGLPLVHIEVKKPQNREGMLAERERMNDRMRQRDFRRFLNITQLMIFSNNEEYDTDSRVPVQGAFYASISRGNIFFNVFREADQRYYETLPLAETDTKREQEVLTSLGKSVFGKPPRIPIQQKYHHSH